jgi:hypothetical protein
LPNVGLTTEAALSARDDGTEGAISIEEIKPEVDVDNDAADTAIAAAEATDADGKPIAGKPAVKRARRDVVIEDRDGTDQELPNRATYVQRFRVTPNRPGITQLTLLAEAWAMGDEVPGPTVGGARDARTFTLVPAAPTAPGEQQPTTTAATDTGKAPTASTAAASPATSTPGSTMAAK